MQNIGTLLMSPMDIETMHFKSINFIYFIVFYEILIFTEYKKWY